MNTRWYASRGVQARLHESKSPIRRGEYPLGSYKHHSCHRSSSHSSMTCSSSRSVCMCSSARHVTHCRSLRRPSDKIVPCLFPTPDSQAHRSDTDHLNNLPNHYSDQRRYAEAVPLYKRALAILEKRVGPDNPTVGESLSNLAIMKLYTSVDTFGVLVRLDLSTEGDVHNVKGRKGYKGRPESKMRASSAGGSHRTRRCLQWRGTLLRLFAPRLASANLFSRSWQTVPQNRALGHMPWEPSLLKSWSILMDLEQSARSSRP
jgi:hypothetical protein